MNSSVSYNILSPLTINKPLGVIFFVKALIVGLCDFMQEFSTLLMYSDSKCFK